MGLIPDQAQVCVDRILALLDEARALGLDRDSDEDAYALRMTRERYLPETLDAYARIPAAVHDTRDALTGKTPDELLIEQLTILERATAQRLMRTADHARAELSANGRFLVERLGSLDSLPEAPPIEAVGTPVTAQRFVETITAGVKRTRDLVDAVAAKLHAAFPLLTEVDRGLFGNAPARRVAITVPIGNDRLRYVLALGRSGEIETTCAKIVRGVTIRTEQVPFETWARALYEDLSAYAKSSAQAQDMLANLIR
jgi:hypothetical protein